MTQIDKMYLSALEWKVKHGVALSTVEHKEYYRLKLKEKEEKTSESISK